MEVIYKKSVVEQIIEVNAEAKLNNKKIDKIILTKDEWEEVKRTLGPVWIFGYVDTVTNSGKTTCKATVDGVAVECVN